MKSYSGKLKNRVKEEWKGEDYGPVTWEELSNMRQNSVILFNSELYPNKISEWSLRAEPGRETKYYICVLCRRLQDRGKREVPPMYFGPPARILVRDGRFLVHPDYPRTPHICGFAENPMSDRAMVLARRAMIRARTEISEDGMTPREKIQEVLRRFREDEKYAHLSEDEIQQMENIICGGNGGRPWSDSSIARSLYINRRKLTSSKNCTKRKVYDCPIVGCDFLTSAAGMIDVHLSEKHKAADGETELTNKNCKNEFKLVHVDDSGNPVLPAENTLDIVQYENDSLANTDYGPVTLEALSNKRRNTIILFKSIRYPNKISEWSVKTPSSDISKYYTCVLCRKLKDSGKRCSPPVEYPPAARIVVRDGRFIVHPDYPKTPHICGFENNPLADHASVLSRRRLVRRVVGNRAVSDNPISVDNIESVPCFKKDQNRSLCGLNVEINSFSDHDVTQRDSFVCSSNDVPYGEDISIMAENSDYEDTLGSDSTNQFRANRDFASHYSLDTQTSEKYQKLESLHSVNPSIPSGNRLYECSIVGCKFMASNQDELNYHIGEHEAIDEPLQTFLMDERTGFMVENQHSMLNINQSFKIKNCSKIEKHPYSPEGTRYICYNRNAQKLDFSYTEIGGDFRRNFNSISSFHKFLDNKSEDSPNLSDESEIVNVDDTKVGSYMVVQKPRFDPSMVHDCQLTSPALKLGDS